MEGSLGEVVELVFVEVTGENQAYTEAASSLVGKSEALLVLPSARLQARDLGRPGASSPAPLRPWETDNGRAAVQRAAQPGPVSVWTGVVTLNTGKGAVASCCPPRKRTSCLCQASCGRPLPALARESTFATPRGPTPPTSQVCPVN